MDQVAHMYGDLGVPGGGVAVLEAARPAPSAPPETAAVAAVALAGAEVAPAAEPTPDLGAQAEEAIRMAGRRNQIACLVGCLGMSDRYAEVVQRVEATDIPIRTGLFLVTGVR